MNWPGFALIQATRSGQVFGTDRIELGGIVGEQDLRAAVWQVGRDVESERVDLIVVRQAGLLEIDIETLGDTIDRDAGIEAFEQVCLGIRAAGESSQGTIANSGDTAPSPAHRPSST